MVKLRVRSQAKATVKLRATAILRLLFSLSGGFG